MFRFHWYVVKGDYKGPILSQILTKYTFTPIFGSHARYSLRKLHIQRHLWRCMSCSIAPYHPSKPNPKQEQALCGSLRLKDVVPSSYNAKKNIHQKRFQVTVIRKTNASVNSCSLSRLYFHTFMQLFHSVQILYLFLAVKLKAVGK